MRQPVVPSTSDEEAALLDAESAAAKPRGCGMCLCVAVVLFGLLASALVAWTLLSGHIDFDSARCDLQVSLGEVEEPTPAPPAHHPAPGPAPGFEYNPLQYNRDLTSPFPLVSCTDVKDDSGRNLSDAIASELACIGKTKCISVFGVLLAGTDAHIRKYGESLMNLVANIVVQLLDADCDGQVDSPDILDHMSMFQASRPHDDSAVFLNFGTDDRSEREGKFFGSYSSQAWKADEVSGTPQIILEEAFHMVHQRGWVKLDESLFGITGSWEDVSSTACVCMKEAQCTWYQHPENYGCTDINGQRCFNTFMDVEETTDMISDAAVPGTCRGGAGEGHSESVEGYPQEGSAQEGGGCSDPSCDCLEFFHKIMTTWAGNKFTGYDRMQAKLEQFGHGMKKNNRDAIERLLGSSDHCKKLLRKMKVTDGKVRLPKSAIKETYTCM